MGAVWPIDGAHQRWSEASIKSTGPRSCAGSRSGSRSALESECVPTAIEPRVPVSQYEFLPNAAIDAERRRSRGQIQQSPGGR